MHGPAALVRSAKLADFENLGPLHEWQDGQAYLLLDRVSYRGKAGAIFTYNNPPVHQMGNPALDAYLAGCAKLTPLYTQLDFLILYGACDPVHAGGDLKESLTRLEETQAKRAELEAAGAPAAEIDALYNWGDARLDKGFALYSALREAGRHLRTVAVCSGGMRFGGSAEVMLMADVLVADSRGGMCFSESQIGLIPGWGGVGRAITKAGLDNARHMAATCAVVKAAALADAGLVDLVVEVPEPFPRKQRTDDPAADKAAFLAALQANNDASGARLLPAALDVAVAERVPRRPPESRTALASAADTAAEVARRADPQTYRELWGQPLKAAAEALKPLGKPLAPQSVETLDALLAKVDEASFDEPAFVQAESRADAELYRDPRFKQGILATLNQTVADFREAE